MGFNPEIERIEIGKNGQRYGKDGNPIVAAPSGWRDTYLRDTKGNYLSYADVFKSEFAAAQKYVDVYPGPANVHVSQALNDFAVSFEVDNSKFIAPTVAPVSTVDHRTNTFYKISRDDVTRDNGNAGRKAVGSVANEIEQGFSTDTYSTTQYAYRSFIPDVTVANADEALMYTTRTTEFLTSVILQDWDRRVISNQLTTANLTNATFPTASGGGGSVKIKDGTQTNGYLRNALNYAIGAMVNANNGTGPTHLLVGMTTAQQMSASAEVAQQVVYDLAGKYLTNPGFNAGRFGLPPVYHGLELVISSVPTNTAKKGQTASFSQLLDNSLILMTIEQPSRRTRNCLTSFRFGGWQTKSYRDEGRAGTYVEVILDQDEKLTNSNAGYIVTAAN